MPRAKTKYKVMVKTVGGPKNGFLSMPMVSPIRKKRFDTLKEAAAFAEGINMYRANTVAKITTEFVAVADKNFYCEGEAT